MKKEKDINHFFIVLSKHSQYQVLDLCSHFSQKKSEILAYISSHFFADASLQDEFLQYSSASSTIIVSKSEYSKETESFLMPKSLQQSVEKIIYRYRFNDKASFFRSLISFFWEKYCQSAFDKNIKEISNAIVSIGYPIEKISIIEGKINIIIQIPETKKNNAKK